MGKGAPAAPNPTSVAQAQTGSNRETAITQAGLNMVNQTDAQGNTLNYNQIGTWADGTPRYEAKQGLSAAGQQLLGATQGTQQNLANLAKEQSGRLSGLLNAPIDFSQQKNYLEGLTSGALDKRWNQLSQQNETDLVNRGIRPGSTQYDNLKNQFMVNQSDAYNSANVNNYNTALQSQMALRQAPLQELLALSGQGQIAQPQFTNGPQTAVAGTDVAGIQQAGYQNQMAGYNAGQQQLGGLFSAGASLIPLLSDRRAKTDIKRIGTADNGLGIYLYRYRSGGPFHIGVMADEVERVSPSAVVMGPDDLLRVNYAEAFA